MKTNILLILAMVTIFGTSNVWAQEKGNLRLGVSAAIGTQAVLNESLDRAVGYGVTGGIDYFISDAFDVALSYTYFFQTSVQTLVADFTQEASTIDLDAKYYFITNGVGVYGFAGASYGLPKMEGTFGQQPVAEPEDKFGMNFGAGIDFYLGDKIFINAQGKWNFPLEQLVFNLGGGINMN